MLFADVKGSMDLAEQTDPEEWREIMQRFFTLLSDGVQRFEGTVDKFTGDGIMALFGAPIAHEDHAARACFAALHIGEVVSEYAAELRRSKALNFSVRIGINSGEVVAGGIGEDEQPAYTAVGHTVGLAQRMEALAEPGKAYLTEHAAKLASGYLELADLGEFEVKGASRPIGVFELVGVGTARSQARPLARARPLALRRARRRDGDARGRARGRPRRPRWRDRHRRRTGHRQEPPLPRARRALQEPRRRGLRGTGTGPRQAIPFMPILQMMRGYFGIEDRDSDRVAREKIAGRLLLLDESFADDLPLVFEFLGVPDPDRPPPPQVSAEARQRALRGVIRRLYKTPNRQETVVNVLEDLHWMDEGSDEFLAEMVGAVEGTQTLAVLNFRPEYEAEWMDSPAYRRIALVPLGLDSTRELLADLAGEDPRSTASRS